MLAGEPHDAEKVSSLRILSLKIHWIHVEYYCMLDSVYALLLLCSMYFGKDALLVISDAQ